MRCAPDVRGRRALGTIAAAAAAAAIGLAVPATAASAAPAERILSAGQFGARAAVPWSKVGPGWALAVYSATRAGTGVTLKAGASTLYLVDPQGGRYRLCTWSAGSSRSSWSLIGWSGDASRALFVSPTSASGREHVHQLQLRTGHLSSFTLPARVSVLGYTRPDGLNIVAVKQSASGATATDQRYSLAGQLQKNLVTLAARGGDGVAYSSDGTDLAVPAVKGLDLISNAGGIIRKLSVPKVTDGCTAVRWWSAATILASCSVAGETGPQLWLVPAGGATPTALTPVRTSGFDLGDVSAWHLSSGLYVNGYGACGSLVIGRQQADGNEQQVSVPGSVSSEIVSATRSALLIERISGCAIGTSLAWFNPATGKTTVAIPVRSHQLGVRAVVPYFIAGKL